MVGIRDFGAACEGMARESRFFCAKEDEEGAAAVAAAAAAVLGRVDESGSTPPARALSLEVRPKRM